MGGRYSQQKGKRGELGLCTDLRRFGYTEVCRIAHWDRSQHNPDVQGKDPNTGILTTFENKSIAQMPLWIAKLQTSHCQGGNRVGRLAFGRSLVAFGSHPLEVQETKDVIFTRVVDRHLETKMRTLYKKLDGADFLVLKGNRGVRVYFKFWSFTVSTLETFKGDKGLCQEQS